MTPLEKTVGYSLRISWWSRKWEQFRFYLLKHLTVRGAGLFLKTNDVISFRPMTSKAHEPALEKFIRECATNGYSDFFIDIGANIGLTTCFVGEKFKSIVMYEPNPLCASVAEVNASIALPTGVFTLRRLALGSAKERLTLKCPRNNWGGAYIEKDNQYSSVTLSRKDGISSKDDSKYLFLGIDVVDTSQEIERIFSENIVLKNSCGGVIKIDAEGYEATILQGLARALPREKKYVIVFEALEQLENPLEITEKFPFQNSLVKLSRLDGWKIPGRPWYRILDRSTFYELSSTQNNPSGDLVLFLRPSGER